jgi:hypothetical protein
MKSKEQAVDDAEDVFCSPAGSLRDAAAAVAEQERVALSSGVWSSGEVS